MVIDDASVGEWAIGLVFAILGSFFLGFLMGKFGGRET